MSTRLEHKPCSCGSGTTLCSRSATPWLIALLAAFALVGTTRADDAAEARRGWIEKMSPEEKEQLRRRQQRFAELDPAEQERLRRLHQQLQRDPNATQLRRVMQGYCRWFSALPPYRQAELLELEPAERVKRIKQLRAEEAQREGSRLPRKDMEGLFRWMEQYVAKHEDDILKSLPEPVRKGMANLDSGRRRRWLGGIMWQRGQSGPPGKPPLMGDDDLKDLKSNLSDDARKRLDAESPEKQWQIIAGWVRSAFRHPTGARRFRGGPPPKDLQEKLDHFFEHELGDEERDRLLSLPGDEMQRELWRMYLGRFKPPDSPIHRPRGPMPPRGKPSGPPGPPRVHPQRPAKGPQPDVQPGGPQPRTRPSRRSSGSADR